MLTYEAMRADVARMIDEEPTAIGADDSLIDLGLDSIRVMMLLERWSQAGAPLDFAEVAEVPTLAHWWATVLRKRAAASG
jgi:aryl carrier-like protein